ncbi:hypothetical protein HGRIS_005982 [Hohenbuehelia grisea]|uniref:F-box domain-containing protein n=1 Tax=Hohenbuehelia grisea TaxID=104357 RepID=A0ABR3K0P0_9AGAR
MHNLPVELLSRIFTLGALQEYPYRDDSPFLLKSKQTVYSAIPSSKFQLKVSHVCRGWRAVALDTPHLWTTVHFKSPKDLPRAEEYIKRALLNVRGHRAIDIMVDTVARGEHKDGHTLCEDQFDDVFRIIFPYVDYWRAFHLKVRDDACKGRARYWLHKAASALRLETLQLYHFEAFHDHHDLHIATFRPPVIVFNNNCPRLVNVSLIGVNLSWQQTPFLRELHHLELALHRSTIRPPYLLFMKMLQESPELRSLHLHYSGPKCEDGEPEQIWGAAVEPFVMANLTHLMLTDVDVETYLDAIIERLRFPALEKLSLDLRFTEEGAWTSFVNLIVAGKDNPLASATLPNLPSPAPPPASPSPSASPAISPVLQTAPLPSVSHRIMPIPNLCNLSHLSIAGLDCDLTAWRDFIHAVPALQILEIDFNRSGSLVTDVERIAAPTDDDDGDGSPEPQEAPQDVVIDAEEIAEHDARGPLTGQRGFFGVLLEGEPLHDPSSSPFVVAATNEPAVSHTPLLPHLHTVDFLGLSASRVREFIRYREGDWVRVHASPAAADASVVPAMSISSTIGDQDAFASNLADPGKRYALSHYRVRRDGNKTDIEILCAIRKCKLRDGSEIVIEVDEEEEGEGEDDGDEADYDSDSEAMSEKEGDDDA